MGLTSNSEGLVYSGSYTCEGHTLHFAINKDNVSIIEVSRMPDNRTWTMDKVVDLDEAIKIQEYYIKLGYTKIT